MRIGNWFSRGTKLQLALERGLKPESDLYDELRKLAEYPIKSSVDAAAICDALSQVVDYKLAPPLGGASSLHALAGLFQDVDGRECPAFPILASRGIPLLVSAIDQAVQGPSRHDEDDLLFVVKILAMYGTREGTDAVIRAARQSIKPDSYWWHTALSAYSENHPEAERLFEALSDPLPNEFLAVALLDAANSRMLNAGQTRHPFDSGVTGVPGLVVEGLVVTRNASLGKTRVLNESVWFLARRLGDGGEYSGGTQCGWDRGRVA